MRSFLVILFSLCAALASAETPPDFQAANTAYAEGRFAEARDIYQKIVDRREFSANLFYNLGNAWSRLENPGQAVLAWERALVLAPTHAEAQANLRRVQQNTGAHLPAEPRWIQYFPVLGAGAYFWIATVAAWVLIFAITARLFGLCRARMFYGAASGAIVVFLLCVPMLQRQIRLENSAVIIGNNTTARYAPTASAAPAAKLPPGSLVRLLAVRGAWAYAESPEAENLWIPAADLARVRL